MKLSERAQGLLVHLCHITATPVDQCFIPTGEELAVGRYVDLQEIGVFAYNAAMGNLHPDPVLGDELTLLREIEALATTLRDRADYHLEIESPTDKSHKPIPFRDDDAMRQAARRLSDKLLDLKRLRNARILERFRSRGQGAAQA